MGLFGKDSGVRETETLAYVRNISADQAREIGERMALMAPARREQIWKTLSLGSSGTWKAERTRDADIRRAKRAVMLAAAVFIKDQAQANAEMARLKQLAENELQLKQRLDSWFCVDSITGAQVAEDAVAHRHDMPNWDNQSTKGYAVNPTGGQFDMVRGRRDSLPFNCYNAVVYWSFQAGAISLRWMWNHWRRGNSNAPDEYKIFLNIDAAEDVSRFDVVDQWMVDASLPKLKVKSSDGIQDREIPQYRHATNGLDNGQYRVPAGRTVILPNPFNKFGHTVLSIGGGKCISQNTMVAGNDFIAMKQAFADDAAEWDNAPKARNHVVTLASLRDGGFFNYTKGYFTMYATRVPFYENYDLSER